MTVYLPCEYNYTIIIRGMVRVLNIEEEREEIYTPPQQTYTLIINGWKGGRGDKDRQEMTIKSNVWIPSMIEQ